MSNLEEEYLNLAEDIAIGSAADGTPKIEEFFNIFSKLAAENGDCPDLEYSPVLNEGSGYRVDGVAFDIPEDAEGASGDLYISVCAYFQNDALPTVNAKDIDKSVGEVERFLKFAISGKRLEELEESSHDYRLAMLLRSYISKIARIRILVFTNAHLKIRKKVFETSRIGDLTVHTNVFDIERYSKISTTGADPVEIDLLEDFSGASHAFRPPEIQPATKAIFLRFQVRSWLTFSPSMETGCWSRMFGHIFRQKPASTKEF